MSGKQNVQFLDSRILKICWTSGPDVMSGRALPILHPSFGISTTYITFIWADASAAPPGGKGLGLKELLESQIFAVHKMK